MSLGSAGRWSDLGERVPTELSELRGPADGTVALPLRLAWSGLTEFDIAQQRLRVGLYQVVITGGTRDDARRYVNAGHLVEDWPLLRRLLGRPYRLAWESRFPELPPRGGPVAGNC